MLYGETLRHGELGGDRGLEHKKMQLELLEKKCQHFVMCKC